MKTKLIAGLIILITLVSCVKDKDNNSNKKVYDFSKISMYDEMANAMNEGDSTQWRYDSDFTVDEKALFDSIDFSNSDITKLITSSRYEKLYFYPNPVRSFGSFDFGRNCDIFNFVMVDSSFNKVLSEIINNRPRFAYVFSGFEPAYYRVYYVCQDSSKVITGMGYGNIHVID
jgi:hypothetical protein